MRLKADLHIHTVASGHAYSTVKEIADVAAQKGLKTIAITDHGINMPDGPHLYHFTNLSAIPQRINGVEILKGVEANILGADGRIDMPENVVVECLDIVLAGLHEGTGYQGNTMEENTEAMVAAIKNPLVHVITHPGNPKFPVDVERVVMAAKEFNKAIEINNSSFTTRPGSASACDHFAKMAKKHNVLVSINSDAHVCYQVGETATAVALALQEGLRKSQIINYSVKHLHEYLAWHKKQLYRCLHKAQ